MARTKKKKQDSLTPRQRQSQRIKREKAARQKREALVRRAFLIGGGVIAVTLVGGLSWLWFSGTAARIYDTTTSGMYRLTARAGFSVDAVYLEGRNRTSMDEVEKAIGVSKGESIFRIDLDNARERLEAIESVREAAIERALPHTLFVRIIEREPVAIWQNQGKLTLIDDNGVAMTGIDIVPYQHLPLVIGEGAPEHVLEVLAVLNSQPELMPLFSAAIYMGERRWNIRLAGDIEVKLPEENPAAAWKSLAELHARQKLLDRAVKTVDLRLPGRLFITVSPQEALPKTDGAKDA